MIALLLSIVLSTYLVLVFKYFAKYQIENVQGIVINYITCVITGLIVSGKFSEVPSVIHQPWFPFACFLGVNFFFIFNMMGYVARTSGVTVTSVASKLSMVIPVAVAIVLYSQPLTSIKIISLIAALVAVILSSLKQEQGHLNWKALLPAFIIFIGSGLNDTTVNYCTQNFLSNDDFALFNIVVFGVASVSGLLTLSFRSIFLHKPFMKRKAVIGGIILGIPNYFSLLFLIIALHSSIWQSSVVFPINNMGIVILTAICGLILFRERISKMNWLGITIALTAIGLLIFTM